MVPLNSGDRLEIWNPKEGWTPFQTAYLTEATEYKLRYHGDPIDVIIQGVPISFYPEKDFYLCTWVTPFQSGSMTVIVNEEEYETYLYPDQRKLTEDQYEIMLKDIMNEASICFQYSGLETQVNAYGKSREFSWTQWIYMEQNFYELRRIFNRIVQQPIRQLNKTSVMMKREKVQRAESGTVRWLDKQGYGSDIPPNVQHVRTSESKNVYENQVLKQQLKDLHRLLRKYETTDIEAIARKAKQYRSIVSGWVNGAFLKDITENKGAFQITQRFRKNPTYRGWYQWFEKLYNHKFEGIGFSYPIPLKDTFQLYEIWCYMMIIKVIREKGYIQDTKGIFRTTNHGVFLDLAENKESRITLTNSKKLYYQRNYQYNTKDFYTYTQRMIPDIVLEGEDSMIIFDPKYRVKENLGTALGEMHKYKDGILHRETGKKAVQHVFILTPTTNESADTMRYFKTDFHERYGMGAIQLLPGEAMDELAEKIGMLLKHEDGSFASLEE
ncbi:DUF2357 domain-containing protein [Oceanobacillus saliphilus]|uniref:DUF2357 domain-containing protein n=1 Tax=Oceanobacillus saliphilus TaxID=2925834 RepID=UPI00201E15CF|nr:DUF2357 domain-containing protein [Oceanobacillus saliphilus]